MDRVTLLTPRRFGDERGWFSETWNARLAAEHGITAVFVGDNHSLSRTPGTLRGLHFQAPPFAQAKLVRCLRGRILDAVVDVRAGSPTFGRHLAVELSAADGRQLYVPVGFAHGFVTLEPDTEVAYKVSAAYAPDHEGGVRWDSAGIAWALPASGPVLSPKDVVLPALAELDSPFRFDGGEPMPERLG